MTILVIIVALFFAMNIGASGAAASMGVAYGAGAIKRRGTALALCALGIVAGAAFGGGNVIKTMGSGIIPTSVLNLKVILIIFISATTALFLANLMGIPLSTSEVTVGSVVGVGIAYRALFFSNVMVIMLLWIIIPVIAFVAALLVGKVLNAFKKRLNLTTKWQRSLTVVLIVAGFLEAFSAGMNNVANAVGPLVGAGVLSLSHGAWLGGAFVALGALVFGSRVLETNGYRITRFSLGEGCAISGTSAGLVIGASLFGIPVPLTQITTSSIIGIGTAKDGFQLWQKDVITKMLKVWAVSPVFSLVISYSMIKLFLESDLYTLIAIGSVILATVGSGSLIRSIRTQKRTLQEKESL
ncbi:inorganic phosphate transporter [Pseudalkalibacillus hwajinpoensis]|uniref:inorganic phosphate transporter n=1 Tax=Guptibacillus hwajinpoensis TaxID=208199 RepID=UPI001CD24919|nr:inorganic phosphate transporter [Pseudalkalibacillus hwajinpoensis]MCA0992931.1 inorganic phosphate transporter family protein [Pseudalkalibacillus hwajinpoensis]